MTHRELEALAAQSDAQLAKILAGAETEINRAYARAHVDITRALSAQIRTGNAVQLLRAAGSALTAQAIERRIAQINRKLDVIPEASRSLARAASESVALELAKSGLVYNPIAPDHRFIEIGLESAVQTAEDWNDLIKPELLRALREAALSRQDPRTVAKKIADIEAKTAPVRKARSHALINTRYAFVRGHSTAREMAYMDAAAATGHDIKKCWQANIDTCCLSCALLHGQIVPLNQDFEWAHLGMPITPWKDRLPNPPLHPNCRCRILAVTPDTVNLLVSPSMTLERGRRIAKIQAALKT